MNDDSKLVALKVNPIVSQPKPVQRFPGALQFAKAFQLSAHHFLRQPAELSEDMELQFLRHPCQFRRAGGIENNLEGSHALVARTGIEPVFQP